MGSIMVLRGDTVSHMTHGEAYLRDILQLVQKHWPEQGRRCQKHAEHAIDSNDEKTCYEIGRAWAYEFRAYVCGDNRMTLTR